MKKPLLTLMCGLPRSGKSTWVKNNKKKTSVVICPDEIRLDFFGHAFHKPAEPMIWFLTEMFMKSLMKQKLDIILDACNITMAIHRWIDIAKENDYKVNLIILNTPYNVCVKRNKKDEKVPFGILKSMNILFRKENIDYLKKSKVVNEVEVINFPN